MDVTYGTRGWYWVMPNGHYGVAVTCHKLLNRKFNKYPDFRYPKGAEDIRYMTPAEFKFHRVPRMLGVDLSRQAELRREHDLRYVGPLRPE